MDAHESPETNEEAASRERDKASLDRKGATKPCEACGGDFAPLGLHLFLQLVGDDKTVTLGQGGEMVAAMCKNCGLMRLHSADLLFVDEDEVE